MVHKLPTTKQMLQRQTGPHLRKPGLEQTCHHSLTVSSSLKTKQAGEQGARSIASPDADDLIQPHAFKPAHMLKQFGGRDADGQGAHSGGDLHAGVGHATPLTSSLLDQLTFSSSWGAEILMRRVPTVAQMRMQKMAMVTTS